MASSEISTQKDAGDLAALISRAAADTNAGTTGLPPVERWNPPFCGDIDMEIRADGTWFYMGPPIGRQPLVRLFSTVLRRDDDGRTYLVTPVEKVGIRVEDAPFLAVEMAVEGQGEALPSWTPFVLDKAPDDSRASGAKPRAARKASMFCVRSAGTLFAVMPSAELERLST